MSSEERKESKRLSKWRERQRKGLMESGQVIPEVFMKRKTGRKPKNTNIQHSQHQSTEYNEDGDVMINSEERKRRLSRQSTRRSRSRNKILQSGQGISKDLVIRRSGRKPLNDYSPPDLRGAIHTSEVSDVKLRKPQRKGSTRAFLNIQDYFMNWSEKMDSIESTHVHELKSLMVEFQVSIAQEFIWFPTFQNSFLLAYKDTENGETVLHPWVEVKRSPLMTEKDVSPYGLFAARDMKKGTIIGIYVGDVSAISEEIQKSNFKVFYKKTALIDVEDESSDNRLHYGVGVHMINDKAYPYDDVSRNRDSSLNNATLYSDLVLVANRDIPIGEEICSSYNLH